MVDSTCTFEQRSSHCSFEVWSWSNGWGAKAFVHMDMLLEPFLQGGSSHLTFCNAYKPQNGIVHSAYKYLQIILTNFTDHRYPFEPGWTFGLGPSRRNRQPLLDDTYYHHQLSTSSPTITSIINNRQPLNGMLSRICNLRFPKSPNQRKQQTTPPPTVNITGVRQPLLADVAPSSGDSKLHYLEDMLLLRHLPNWWLSRLCDLLVFRDFQIHEFHLCRPALALPNLRVCCLPAITSSSNFLGCCEKIMEKNKDKLLRLVAKKLCKCK